MTPSNSLNALARRQAIEMTPAESIVVVSLSDLRAPVTPGSTAAHIGLGDVEAPHADRTEAPQTHWARHHRKWKALGALGLIGLAGGVTAAALWPKHHAKNTPVPVPPGPGPAPAWAPSYAPALAPAPTGPTLAPVGPPAPAPEPATSVAPAPAISLTTQPHSDAYQISPYSKPLASGQVVAGKFLTLVVSTNGNACGQVRNDPAHALVLQLARPQMANLTPGTYAGIPNVTAPEGMANVTSAPSGLTGYAGLGQDTLGGTATLGNDLKVTLASVSDSGGNFTGSFSLTVNNQLRQGDFNAQSCGNLFGGV